MRLGIFGGTFDPIHYGHLILAEQCREQCQLDEVWFVPAAQPPHKLGAMISNPKSRCEMINFAIAGHPAFRLSQIELNRSGPSFTVTTLEQLIAADPARELFLLIGADSLRDFPHWREPARILELATIVAVNRGDRPVPDRSTIRSVCGELADRRIVSATMPAIDLSATDIRLRVSRQHSIRFLVPRAVEVYIHEQRLYAGMVNPTTSTGEISSTGQRC
jgi:nicotinate-nucleotide adenylyltransferase